MCVCGEEEGKCWGGGGGGYARKSHMWETVRYTQERTGTLEGQAG